MKQQTDDISEKWSAKYKRSINCSKPKGFSQRAHCAGRKKRKKMYKEIEEAKYIMDMMKEDVFGHRVTQYSPRDTIRLKNKLYQPTSDKDKEAFVAVVEPLMKRKSFVSPNKDAFLDSFIDLDTRVSQRDFIRPEDETDELDYLFGGIESILDEE